MEIIGKLMYTGICLAVGAGLHYRLSDTEHLEAAVSNTPSLSLPGSIERENVLENMAYLFSEVTAWKVEIDNHNNLDLDQLLQNDNCNSSYTFRTCNQLMNNYLTCSLEQE